MSDDEKKATYTELRKNALLKTYITIVINGTKKQTKHSQAVVSDGVLEEGRLSFEQGNVVIPLAVTGGAAQQLWQEINDSGSEYSKSDDFQSLSAGASFSDVLEAVKGIIKKGGANR